MAEEQLTLVDGMSASLRRIYQEAERLNRRIVTLKTNIKSLEKPMSLSFLRRELKETENQAKLTETALKRAVKIGEKEGVLSWNARYRGIQHVMPYGQKQFIKDADLIRYGQRLEKAPIRRNKMLWDTGRTISSYQKIPGATDLLKMYKRADTIRNIGTFEERLAKLQQKSFSNMFTKPDLFLRGMSKLDKEFGILSNSSSSLTSDFMRVTSALLFFGGILTSVANVANRVFVEPQSNYMSNFTRVAMTSDKSKTPSQMMDDLYDTASRTRAPADATFMLYNRIALSGVKASNERIRRFVESFNKITAISGTTGQENRAVMLQLAQGMGSNRLGGDEFRSISEQAPLFKYMLAKGLGVNPGALKEMGAKGKLTAEAILTSIEKMQDKIDFIFKEAPLTIDQSLNILQNRWSQLVNQQFVGYIAIRDLIKDITIWMTTPKGKEVISRILTTWNIMLYKTVQWIRQLAPHFIWMLNHIKLIKNAIFTTVIAIYMVKTAINLLKMTVMFFKFYEWFMSASEGAIMLRGAVTGLTASIKVAGATLHTWIPELLIILGLVLSITKLLPAVKSSIKESSWVEQQLHKKFTPQQLAQAANDQNKLLNSNGVYVKPSKVYYAVQKERERLTKQYRKEHPQEGTPEYYQKLNKESMQEFQKIQKNMTGITDSSKNVPMVGKVNEVGKINDKISIDNDGIEMMKAIAERQWVMQNEVTIPQKVDVKVERTVDVNEDRIVEAITGGMKTAVASSMRGAMQ
ncbi:MAG: tape measure protein [Methanobrevibacter sp.]|uniref:tape measure protein n=1 Tax=Methanobrevibacter sp. TaxID=66852 RepID=UPI0031F5B41A|nr:tape measure protein [Methanobrevibacter sp.]